MTSEQTGHSEYSRAALEFQSAWTTAAAQHWRQRLDELWRTMTDEERLREPWVHQEHYRDLRNRGVLPEEPKR
jgi:predicted ATPase